MLGDRRARADGRRDLQPLHALGGEVEVEPHERLPVRPVVRAAVARALAGGEVAVREAELDVLPVACGLQAATWSPWKRPRGDTAASEGEGLLGPVCSH